MPNMEGGARAEEAERLLRRLHAPVEWAARRALEQGETDFDDDWRALTAFLAAPPAPAPPEADSSVCTKCGWAGKAPVNAVCPGCGRYVVITCEPVSAERRAELERELGLNPGALAAPPEAQGEPRPRSRWAEIVRRSPSGKSLFACLCCGRVSPTPDKTCRTVGEPDEPLRCSEYAPPPAAPDPVIERVLRAAEALIAVENTPTEDFEVLKRTIEQEGAAFEELEAAVAAYRARESSSDG